MTKIELVFIPTPGMGHLLSIIEFAKLLVQTNPKISILVVIFHVSTEPTKISSYIESQSREVDPTRITFITLPPLSNPPDPSSLEFFKTVVQLQIPLVKKVVQDRQIKPAGLILDLMNASMIDVGVELDIPCYIYFTGGTNLLYLMFHFQALADQQGLENVTEMVGENDDEMDLPGFLNPVPNKVVPWVFFDKGTVWPSLVIDLARRFREAKGIIVNSFVELECCTIQALGKLDMVPTVYPMGPLLSLNNRGDSKPADENNIISWLDEQPKSSVVFLCFGSMGCFDAEQVKEIANGLEKSGFRFLWSLRKPLQVGSSGGLPSENETFEEALPEGFMDRTAHRGKIIPWAPQVMVLAHEAIGGFVSHCGWNSILESIWFGVPIATWPMYSEQQLNAFTLVRELGLAVEISLDYRWDFKKQTRNYLVTADEVEISVRKLMSLDEGTQGKVSEMRDISRKVLSSDDGSSYDSLCRFITGLTQNEKISVAE